MTPQQFQQQVNLMIKEEKEIKVHVGCGPVHLDGFLHVDIRSLPKWHKEIYVFDASNPWPCPNDCVNFIFHEDFLEHLDQRGQIRFLAETLRVMKSGACQYVSVPSLEWVMAEHSIFGKGARGVHEEWRTMKHQLLHTEETLKEFARLVGFEYLPLLEKHPLGTRPNPDGPAKRDARLGNIFAFLSKP